MAIYKTYILLFYLLCMEIQTPELLKTLSNKTNLEIINLLKNEPSYPRKVAEILGMQEGYISRTLSNLEKLGILRSQWAYRERNVKLYYVDTEEISISFEPEGLKICVKTRGEKEVSVSYDAFKFDIPEIQEFVGRTREMDILDRSSFVVIEGLPGIGKTYVAAKYVHAAQQAGKKIFWHTFTEIDSFHYLINKLSVFLNNVGYSNLLEYVKQEGKDDRVLLSLFREGVSEDMVFCFDGLQKVQDRKINTLFKLLRNVKGKIIITSRERPPFISLSRTDITELKLHALPEKETRKLLRSRGVHLPNGVSKKAQRILGGHPLLLDMFCEAARDAKPAEVLQSIPVDQVEDYLWSEIFEKLSEKDRAFVECLSVFRVPAPPEILKKVYAESGFWTVLKSLEKRMFIWRQHGGYVLPSTITEFTYRKVTNRKELHTEIAANYEKQKNPEGLLEAMYHYIKAGDQEKAAHIVDTKEMDLIERGFLAPYLDILEQITKENVSPELWCCITHEKGRILVLYGDSEGAEQEFIELLNTAEQIGSKKGYARALHQLGNVYAVKGEWEKAQKCFNQSLNILEKLQYFQDMVNIYADTGLFYMKQGKFKDALTHFKTGKELAEKIDYKTGVSEMLRGMANVYFYQDQFDTALQYQKESLHLAEKIRDVRGVAANYNTLGLIYFYKGDLHEAISCFKKNLEISERISDIEDQIMSYGNLGMVYADTGEREPAEMYYKRARELAEQLEDPYDISYLKMKMAHLYLEQGAPEKAAELCTECLEQFEELEKSLYYGEFCRVYGSVLREMGKWEKAETFFQLSVNECSDSPLELGKTYCEYAVGIKKIADFGPEPCEDLLKNAHEYYQKALNLFEKVSAQREIEKAQKKWDMVNGE